jgi:N-acetyl-anhydromuramyl-L-alanine amidase AmpD
VGPIRFHPEQYTALFHLGGALCGTFPKIRVRVPRDAKGRVLDEVLPESEQARFEGILAHWHLSKSKVDPGPAFDWSTTLEGIRTYMQRRKPR